MFFRIFGTVIFFFFFPPVWAVIFGLIPPQIIYIGLIAIATGISTIAFWHYSDRGNNEQRR